MRPGFTPAASPSTDNERLMTKRRFQPSIAALTATAVVMAVCVQLGLWQLSRAQEKNQWQAQLQSRGAQAEQSLEALSALQDPAHYPVNFSGVPDNAHNLLLDNRILDGVAGYHVLTPVHSDSGVTVLVNRGWLARGRDRAILPDIAPLPSPVSVRGRTYVPGEAFTLQQPGQDANGWPRRIQAVELGELSQLLGTPLAPFQIQVSPGLALETGEQMPRVWHDARLGPERHRAYALQWFAMAGAVLLIFLFASLRRPQANNQMDG